jgi:hypothetical protein
MYNNTESNGHNIRVYQIHIRENGGWDNFDMIFN